MNFRRISTPLLFLSAALSFPAFATTQSQQMPWPKITVPTNRPASSISKDQAADLVTQTGYSYLNNIFNSTNRPDWLTRTDITYAMQHNTTPVSAIESIQPIYQDIWSTVFWQGRAAYNDGSMTYNFGLGYRYLTSAKNLMWGLNMFFDENPRFVHKRLGLGGEVFMPYVTFRANYYDALTGQQRVGVNTYERALNGFDIGIETPVPYVSWMRFTAQGYHWEGVAANDVNGGLMNLRIFPARQLEIDAGIADDNSQHAQAFLKLDYYFGSPAFIQSSATTPHTNPVWAAQNLEDMRLEKVIRHNDIVVEKTIGTASGSAVIIARGT